MNGDDHKINLSDVYYKLGKLDKLPETVERIDSRLDRITKDHENRIKTLEIYKANLKGKLTVISFIAGAFGSVALLLLKVFITKR